MGNTYGYPYINIVIIHPFHHLKMGSFWTIPMVHFVGRLKKPQSSIFVAELRGCKVQTTLPPYTCELHGGSSLDVTTGHLLGENMWQNSQDVWNKCCFFDGRFWCFDDYYIIRRPWTKSGNIFFFGMWNDVNMFYFNDEHCLFEIRTTESFFDGWIFRSRSKRFEAGRSCGPKRNRTIAALISIKLVIASTATTCRVAWMLKEKRPVRMNLTMFKFRKRWHLVKRLWILIQWHLQGKLRLAKICHLHSHSIPILLPTKHLNIQNILCQKSSWKPDPEWFFQPSQPFGPLQSVFRS